MDSLEHRLKEEIDFWQDQITRAEQRDDRQILPRLRDALALVRYRLKRYQRRKPKATLDS